MVAVKKRHCLAYRVLSVFISFTFIFSLVIPSTAIQAQILPQTVLNLPIPGTMVPVSAGFTPALIKGITLHPENPLEFDFIVDSGDARIEGAELREEAYKMIKYFMAALTVPDEELWVNLSPYEKNRIIPDGFGDTEMGRDLLAQDYLLKQLTSSMIYPEDEIGAKFWYRVYQKAAEKFGTTEIPINTFNKIWIVPEKAVIYEHGTSAFVVESRLKVMLEEDYVALQENLGSEKFGTDLIGKSDVEKISELSSGIIKEILIPEIEKEINEGKSFANLRQIYNSMILAVWYKKNLKESLLGQVYASKNKTRGVDTEDKEINKKIYNQYLEAFKTGVYNYIKEDYDPATQQVISRKYFSGGGDFAQLVKSTEIHRNDIDGLEPIAVLDLVKYTNDKIRHDVIGQIKKLSADKFLEVAQLMQKYNNNLTDEGFLNEFKVIVAEIGQEADKSEVARVERQSVNPSIDFAMLGKQIVFGTYNKYSQEEGVEFLNEYKKKQVRLTTSADDMLLKKQQKAINYYFINKGISFTKKEVIIIENTTMPGGKTTFGAMNFGGKKYFERTFLDEIESKGDPFDLLERVFIFLQSNEINTPESRHDSLQKEYNFLVENFNRKELEEEIGFYPEDMLEFFRDQITWGQPLEKATRSQRASYEYNRLSVLREVIDAANKNIFPKSPLDVSKEGKNFTTNDDVEKVAVFAITGHPMTIAHRSIARRLFAMGFSKVIVVIQGFDTRKVGSKETQNDRMAMAVATMEKESGGGIVISDFSIGTNLIGEQQWVPLMKRIRKQFPNIKEIGYVIGEDHFQFKTSKGEIDTLGRFWEIILDLKKGDPIPHILVVPRYEGKVTRAQEIKKLETLKEVDEKKIVITEIEPLSFPVSATAIREMIAIGRIPKNFISMLGYEEILENPNYLKRIANEGMESLLGKEDSGYTSFKDFLVQELVDWIKVSLTGESMPSIAERLDLKAQKVGGMKIFLEKIKQVRIEGKKIDEDFEKFESIFSDARARKAIAEYQNVSVRSFMTALKKGNLNKEAEVEIITKAGQEESMFFDKLDNEYSPTAIHGTNGEAFFFSEIRSINFDAAMMAKQTVLVVDDEEMLRNMTKEFLEMKGYEVLVAENGQEALKVIERQKNTDKPIGQVLTDFNMPGMNGVDLFNKINGELPVTILTGNAEEAKKQLDQRANEVTILQKGTKLINITEAMERHMPKPPKPSEPKVTKPDTTGGIDLNPVLLDLQIKRDGNGVPLPIGQQPIYDMKIDGFLPIIINVTPIHNLPLLLGEIDIEETGEDEDLVDLGYNFPFNLKEREEYLVTVNG